MDAEIITRSAFWVVGLHYRGTNENEELPALWRQFWPRHSEIRHRAEPSYAYGIVDHFDPGTKTMGYWAGVEGLKDSKVPKGMAKLHIPAQTYTVFQCTLPMLMETIRKIYGEWFPSSVYARAEGPEFELYDERFDIDQEKYEMSMWVPVKKK
jgi:AraC family transcriptional regulator